MNNKVIRYTLGFILMGLILLSFYSSNIMLIIASAFFIIIALYEYRNMFKVKDIYPHKFLPEIVGIICAYIFIVTKDLNNHNFVVPVLLGGTVLSFFLTIVKNKKPYIMTTLSTIGAFLLIFCGLYIIKLTYFFKANYDWYLVSVYFVAVLSGDYTASIFGKKFKKIYIAPEISPNKTLAGSLANLIFSCISCLLLKFFIELSILQCIILGITISVFAQTGDLAISTLKRDIGVKHSSTFFYEYGGVLDRMDAFLFSAPAAYYCLYLLNEIKPFAN